MSMKRVTLEGGPLNGKTYDMPAETATWRIAGGTYTIDGTASRWAETPPEQATPAPAPELDAAPGEETPRPPADDAAPAPAPAAKRGTKS